MHRYSRLAVGLLCLVLLSMACKREVALPGDFGYEYYPLDIGRYWVYQQDTIIFDPDIGMVRKDSMSALVREEIVDTLRDNTGALVYRLERFERATDSLPWEIRSVYTLSRNAEQAIRTEENLRYIKLVFPPISSQRWDGNASFDEFQKVEVAGENIEMFKGWAYAISNSDTSLQLGNLSFDKVVKVVPSDYESFIELRSVQEYYAPNVGLVYRELQILDTQCDYCCNFDLNRCDTLAWVAKAEAGFILRQQLIDYQ